MRVSSAVDEEEDETRGAGRVELLPHAAPRPADVVGVAPVEEVVHVIAPVLRGY